MATICVPDAALADALADLAGEHRDLRTLIWVPGSPPAAGADEIEFLVPAYSSPPMAPADFAALRRLKVLQLLLAGVDAWIGRVPVGITVCGGRGIHGASTAELAVAAILSHLRKLPAFAAAQRQRRWDSRFTDGLRGKRVVVVGAGDVGHRVAAVANIFEADVTVVARRERPGVRAVAELAALLPTADVVVLAVPDTPATAGLVDADFLAALPDGALLVNVARGALVVTDALVAELASGRLHAFLDVVDVEPLPADHPLWTLSNAVLTPHVGGGTPGWREAAARLVHDQVERYLRGEPLANVVVDGY